MPKAANKPKKATKKQEKTARKNSDDNSLKVLTHILALLSGFIAPLIILLAVKEEDVKEHAKKALNWQISLLIYVVASFILIYVFIGFITLFVVMLLDLIFCIMAAVKASRDETEWTVSSKQLPVSSSQ